MKKIGGKKMTYYWLNLLKKTLKHEENPEGNKSERFI